MFGYTSGGTYHWGFIIQYGVTVEMGLFQAGDANNCPELCLPTLWWKGLTPQFSILLNRPTSKQNLSYPFSWAICIWHNRPNPVCHTLGISVCIMMCTYWAVCVRLEDWKKKMYSQFVYSMLPHKKGVIILIIILIEWITGLRCNSCNFIKSANSFNSTWCLLNRSSKLFSFEWHFLLGQHYGQMWWHVGEASNNLCCHLNIFLKMWQFNCNSWMSVMT